MIPKELTLANHLNPLMPVFICIRNSIQSLATKKMTKTSKADIFEIVNAHGTEAQKFMFSCLIQSIDTKEIKQKGQTSGKVNFLNQALIQLSTRENFMYYFAEVLIGVVKSPLEYVQSLIKYLKLQMMTQIIMGLSLYLSENQNVSKDGCTFLKNKLNQYYQSGKPVVFPPKILQEMLFQIGKNPQLHTDLQDSYQYLLDTNTPDKVSQVKYYHFLNKNSRVYNYEPPLVTKPSEIIRKADILRDLGPYCTFNVQSLKTVLQQFGPLTQQDVFECLMIMAEENTIVEDSIDRFMTDLMVANKKINKAEQWKKFYNSDFVEKKMQAAWNIDSFLTYSVQNVANLKWTSVLGYFDRLNLQFKSHGVFINMFKFFQKAKKQGPKYKTPEVLFFKRWNHPRSQLTFLLNLFKCQNPDIFALNEINNKKVIKSVADSLKNNNSNPLIQQIQIWAYPDLVQLLIELSDYDFMSTRQLFEIPLSRCPELLLQTLSEIHFTRGDAMLNELFSQLFPFYLANHTSHVKFLENLWESNEDMVISSICELYKTQNKKQNSCLNLSKVLDITQNIREGLIPLSNWNDYQFAVALGVLAGKRQFLHFQQWIKERLKNIGSPFLIAVLQYVEDNFLRQMRDYISKYGANNQSIHQSIDIQLQKAQLNRQLLAFIYQSALQFPSSKFTTKALQMMKKQYKEICQHFPQMTDSQVVDEIELLAQKNFCKIYKGQITLEQAIQMMHKLKNSNKQQEKQLYASMITYLFTELRFHSNYPEKELMTTANFFAAIINAKFIQKKLFNVFTLVLAEDLKFNDRRYDFAITVINQIKERFTEEPHFVEQLLNNQFMMAKNPELIKDLIQKFNPPLDLSPQKLTLLKIAMDNKYAPPPVQQPQRLAVTERQVQITESDSDLLQIQEKIEKCAKNSPNIGKLNLLCNTLSKDSILDKVNDLRKWLDSKELIRWFSYHLVYKRITNCNQSNMFDLYSSLINEMPLIQKPVTSLSYRILQKWFCLQGKSINDKKLKAFKNLGTWIGRITLARNQPLLITKLNLKQILIKSYSEKARLQMNLQVIAKILENRTLQSFIFSIKNPWLSPILGTLRQLNGKTNDNHVKAQIIRLFRNINIPEAEIIQTNYLSYSIDKATLTIAELPDYVQICDQDLKVYIDKGVDLRKIIAQAVDAAIQQIVPPVISRSVTIALVTTKQLALKDFVLQPDDQKLLKGTHYIVQNLSGSLALVTCREPLKMSLSNFLKKKLQQSAFLTQNDKEFIILTAIRDNLDLGCALIKRAVIQKALQQIDKDPHIIQQLQKRREAKANGQMFQSDLVYVKNIAQWMPQPIGPKVGGISDQQFRVYQDFQKDKRTQSNGLLDKKTDALSNKQKLDKAVFMIQELESLELIKQFIQKHQFTTYSELGQKVHHLIFEQRNNFKYYLQILKLIKSHIKPDQMFNSFLENIPKHRKQYQNIINQLSNIGYFPPEANKYFSKKSRVQTYDDKQYEQKARGLLEEWTNCDKQIQDYLSMLSDRFTKGDDQEIKKFFFFTISYAVEQSLRSKCPASDVLNYKYIDEESKLIVVSLKIVSNNRSVYLDHISEAIIMVIHKYHDVDARPFNQRPFFRLIMNIIYDISRKNYKFDENIVLTVYTAFSTLLHKLEPSTYPGFSFAWLQLVSNKYFMPVILENYQYWDLYHELLLDLLKFAKNKLTADVLSSNQLYRTYYKGILRLVTILLHDFPDFSSEFSFTLSNQIPDRFIQLRNVILSAFPKSQWFPEPQNVQAKELSTIKYIQQLPKYYKTKLEKGFQIFGIFRSEQKLLALKNQLESMYFHKIEQSSKNINSFILNASLSIYESSSDPKEIEANQQEIKQLLLWVLSKIDHPVRQKFLKGILNLVRFPNLLTLFFIHLIDDILYRDCDPSLQEALVKVIIERMTVQKPHPWGLIFIVNEMKINKKKLNHLTVKEIHEL